MICKFYFYVLVMEVILFICLFSSKENYLADLRSGIVDLLPFDLADTRLNHIIGNLFLAVKNQCSPVEFGALGFVLPGLRLVSCIINFCTLSIVIN